MGDKLNELLKSKFINSWNLFWLVSVPMSLVIGSTMLRTDLSGGDAVSTMIQLSVYCAVPFLYLAFAASSLHELFPSSFSRWLRRNRNIMGLCFAAAMAWQLLFILWMVTVYTGYFMENVYVFSDEVEGVGGYLFIIAMVLTSFNFGRKWLSPKQWKLLHTCGIYWLWIYVWSVYWWQLFYYPDPITIDYVYYWTGFAAWGLRMGAWTKKRWQQAAVQSPT
jgi:hypothetical protein